MGRGCCSGPVEMAKLIASPSSTVPSLVTSNWWIMPAKNRCECSATSSTARAWAGGKRAINVGW